MGEVTNRVGLMLPNGSGEYVSALDLGCSIYLVMEGTGVALEQVRAIKGRYPDARVLMRRPGGVSSNVIDVVNDLQSWYPTYAALGVTDWIGWNEPDRFEEGGWGARQVADYAATAAPLLRAACPGIRLHWPAAAHEGFYQQVGIWKAAADLFDCLDGHWYVDADGVDALGRFFESHFPGKEWFITEYSSRGLNAPPPRRGVEPDAYEACRKAHLWPLCRGVLFFIWRWPGAEPGGQVEEIANDPETKAALTRAAGDFHVVTPPHPEPQPEPPTPPEPEPEKSMITSAMYIHQTSGGGRAYREQSYREFAQTAKTYGIQSIWWKAFQGGSLAVWDKGPLGLSTYDRIKQCYDECASEGVEAVFWGVPQSDTWQADAAICKAIGAIAGGKIHIDLENFDQFWGANKGGVTGQPPFFQMLKDAELIVDVSAVGRFGEPELTPWEEIVDLVDSVHLQSYWSDFNAPAVRVVIDDINAMLRVGVPIDKLGSIFPWNGTRADMDAAYEAARTLGVTRISVWTWDWAGLAPFHFLHDLNANQPQPEPEEPVNKDTLWSELVGIGAGVRSSAETLIRVSTPGNLEITEEAALNEVYRIGGLWSDAGLQVRDLALRLKE